jgi:hypothetical protein
MSGGEPPKAACNAPRSRCRAASAQAWRRTAEGWLRSARSPPGGTQASTGMSGAPCARANSAAYRIAGRHSGDPLTPTMTLNLMATTALPSLALDCYIQVNPRSGRGGKPRSGRGGEPRPAGVVNPAEPGWHLTLLSRPTPGCLGRCMVAPTGTFYLAGCDSRRLPTVSAAPQCRLSIPSGLVASRLRISPYSRSRCH